MEAILKLFKPFRGIRSLHLHEHASKELMQKFGVNTQGFFLAKSAADASPENIKARLGSAKEYVVKAQVLAGGRGRGHFRSSGLKGGVQLTQCPKEVQRLTSLMLGDHIITEQTGGMGVLVNKVMVAEARELVKEAYFSILLDRKSQKVALIASNYGGMDIERVASQTPNAIIMEHVSILDEGPSAEQLSRLVDAFLMPTEVKVAAIDQLRRLYAMFLSLGAIQIEVNPFGLTPEGDIVCFDSKVDVDDNENFRRKEFFDAHSEEILDHREVVARDAKLNYIGLDGSIGCLVNGAGLAMATMDMLALNGGRPANFLDVGGVAQEDSINKACQLLLRDPQLECILVNIFGGIVRCDMIAHGILRALEEVGSIMTHQIPLIVRLAGTNDAEAKELLRTKYPTQIEIIDDLEEAAIRVTNITKSRSIAA